MTSLSLDLYLDYLLHKDQLRNLFTLYYRREAVVGEETRCFTPLASRLGWIEVSDEDAEVMGFFDWVGVIVRCALYLREQVPRRVVEFARLAPRDESRLQQAIDIELNEKAKQEAIVYREGCNSRLMAWDKQTLAEALERSPDDLPDNFEGLYACLDELDSDESDEEEGPPEVMMPIGLEGDDPLAGNGSPSDEEGESLTSAMQEGGEPAAEKDGKDQDEGEESEGEQETDETQEDQGGQGAEGEDQEEVDEGSGQGDDASSVMLAALTSLEDDEVVDPPAGDRPLGIPSGFGFSRSVADMGGNFVRHTDTPLEALVEMMIKTARGEQGKEKGQQKVRWKTHWAGYHRKLSHVQEMLGDDAVLPPKRRRKEPPRGKGKFKLCVYLDTSYSCTKESKRFFSLVTNMSPERFEIALHSFSNGVKQHEIEAGKFNYRLGGTNIDAVLAHAGSLSAEKEFDAIVVLTDGEFDDVRRDPRIRQPDKWHWVLTPRHIKGTMPSDSHFYDLPRR